MAKIYGKKDLWVSYDYDLVFSEDDQGNIDIARTDTHPAHALAQSVLNCFKTERGEFVLFREFGANPRKFIGSALNSGLLSEIENHIRTGLSQSGVLEDGLSFSVKVAPIDRDRVIIRMAFTTPRDTTSPFVKIDMLYSTADNGLYPLTNGYGGQLK